MMLNELDYLSCHSFGVDFGDNLREKMEILRCNFNFSAFRLELFEKKLIFAHGVTNWWNLPVAGFSIALHDKLIHIFANDQYTKT